MSTKELLDSFGEKVVILHLKTLQIVSVYIFWNDDRFAQLMDIYDVKKMYADESYVYVDGLDFNN